MLILRWDFEVRKDQYKDEQVIDRQRQLDQITRQKFERLLISGLSEQLPAQRPEQQSREDERERHPDSAPNRSIFVTDFVRLAIKDAEVYGQHQKDKKAESNPCQGRDSNLHRCG